MSKLAFFDLDRTLLSYNSARGWIKREVRLGFINRWTAIKGGWYLLQYGLGISSMEEPIRQAGMLLQGSKEEDLIQRTQQFWEEEVIHHIREKSQSVLERHRQAGDEIILLTSSSVYLGNCAARHLNIPYVLANRFVVQDGVFTGEMVSPLCYGQGKVYYAKQLAAQLNKNVADGVFYTDSYSDIEMLLAVDNPVVIHPDKRLERVARKKGWPIEKWSL